MSRRGHTWIPADEAMWEEVYRLTGAERLKEKG